MKRVAGWLVAVALLAGAWAVNAIAPGGQDAYRPFAQTIAIGQEAHARTFTAVVQQVGLARSVTADGGWAADGSWLLVDLDAAGTREQPGTLLSGATLTVGDRVFRASERMTSLFERELVPGIPQSGTLAFELPEDATSGAAVLRLATTADPRGDSLLELTIELDELPVSDAARIRAAEWTNP